MREKDKKTGVGEREKDEKRDRSGREKERQIEIGRETGIRER